MDLFEKLDQTPGNALIKTCVWLGFFFVNVNCNMENESNYGVPRPQLNAAAQKEFHTH